MATSALDDIEKELECTICIELLVFPKYAGSCQHSFCRGCLKDYVKSLKAVRRFPCPNCNGRCTLTPEGVDGLKDDFKSASLISKLQDAVLERKELHAALGNPLLASDREHCCHFCEKSRRIKNVAKLICDTCDFELCEVCKNIHIAQTQDLDNPHYVFQICASHGLRMKHFCVDCNRVICIQCWSCDHSRCSLCTFYKDIPTRVLSHSEKQVEQAEKIRSEVCQKFGEIETCSNELQRMKGECRKAILDEMAAEIDPLDTEITAIRKQLEDLQSRLAMLESEKASREASTQERVTTLVNYCDDYTSSFEDFRGKYSTTMTTLEETKQLIRELKNDRCLELKYNDRLNLCQAYMQSILLSLEHLDRSVSTIDICKVPKLETNRPSMLAKVTSFFDKLSFM